MLFRAEPATKISSFIKPAGVGLDIQECSSALQRPKQGGVIVEIILCLEEGIAVSRPLRKGSLGGFGDSAYSS